MVDGKTRLSIRKSTSNIQRLLNEASNYKLILIGPPPVIDNDLNKRIKLLTDIYEAEALKRKHLL